MKQPNSVNAAAMTAFKKVPGVILRKKCARKYNDDEHRPPRNAEQRDAVNGKPCWECERDNPNVGVANFRASGKSKKEWTKDAAGDWSKQQYRTHDHQPPLCVAWEMGGCHMGKEAFLAHFSTAESVLPHCEKHYRSQGSPAGKYAKHMRASA